MFRIMDIFKTWAATPRCHGNFSDTDDDKESSALIAKSNKPRSTESETYVVPNCEGQYPDDLSDSDDDFFEKPCSHYKGGVDNKGGVDDNTFHCLQCNNIPNKTTDNKPTEISTEKHTSSSQRKQYIDPKSPDIFRTRTTKSYSKEEMGAAHNVNKQLKGSRDK